MSPDKFHFHNHGVPACEMFNLIMEPFAGWLITIPANWTKENWIFHNHRADVKSTLVDQWPCVIYLEGTFCTFWYIFWVHFWQFSFADHPYASVAIPTHSAVDLRASWLAADLVKEAGLKSKRRRTRRRGTRSDEAFAPVQYQFKTIWSADGVCLLIHINGDGCDCA